MQQTVVTFKLITKLSYGYVVVDQLHLHTGGLLAAVCSSRAQFLAQAFQESVCALLEVNLVATLQLGIAWQSPYAAVMRAVTTFPSFLEAGYRPSPYHTLPARAISV